VARRDDLSLEVCALYNQTGKPEKARALLDSRHFQPWEGGEGLALGQHVRTCLLLARAALAQANPTLAQASAALATRHCEEALASPPHLGEARHLLANQSDIYFWLGQCRAAAGDSEGARDAWRTAAESRGDFQEMSVRLFSEMTYFSALAWKQLGETARARKLLRELLAYARDLEKQTAKIDYFATSLPTMLLFHADLQATQALSARFLQAQALLGLGGRAEAEKGRALLQSVLKEDPSHALAEDLLRETTPA
jgi:tetratricopeptide (TPR) repeat protein